MTAKTLTTIAAVLIASASLTLPATAGGQFAINYAPTDPEQAQMLSTGLTVFGLVNGLKNGANVMQNGSGNSAGIGQWGSGNNGLIVQEGDGHNGTIQQTGNNNSCGLFQFGEATDAECIQNGDGEAGATVVFGF